MALDVTVNIKLAEIVGNVGTWFPCLYVENSTLTMDTYDEYSKLSELAEVGSGKTLYPEDSEVYAAASKLFAQDEPPKKIAVISQAAFSAQAMDTFKIKGWRQLVLVGNHTNATKIAEYVEGSTTLMLFVGVGTEEELNTLYSSVKGFDRTFIVYHTTDVNAVAAVVGATSGRMAGSFTYKNMRIKGIEPDDLSSTTIERIHSKGAIAIVEKVGDVVTSEGKVASGQYADIVDSKDYVIQNIEYKTQKVFNMNPKVPYTNKGIAMLEAATLESLKTAYNNGMIADKDDGTPDFSTHFALRSETSEVDRAMRHYPYGTFTFALAGAIHDCIINGTITV